MVEFGHYFLLHLFLLYTACLHLGCYVDHLFHIVGASDTSVLLNKALYSSEIKKSENMKSSKTARVLTLIYLVGVVVKIEPIVVEELRLLIIVGCCAGRQCDLPLQQGLLGPGE